MIKDTKLKVAEMPPIPKGELCSFYDYMAMKEMSDRSTCDPPIVSDCCEAPIYYSFGLDDNICTCCKKSCKVK